MGFWSKFFDDWPDGFTHRWSSPFVPTQYPRTFLPNPNPPVSTLLKRFSQPPPDPIPSHRFLFVPCRFCTKLRGRTAINEILTRCCYYYYIKCIIIVINVCLTVCGQVNDTSQSLVVRSHRSPHDKVRLIYCYRLTYTHAVTAVEFISW